MPAKFRTVANAQGLNGIVCFPSIQGDFLEGCGPAFSDTIDEMLNKLDPFSRERDALAAILLGDSVELMFDADGRIVLPEELRHHAKIKDEATFVGLGEKFQIWEPKAFEAFRSDAVERARANGGLLRSPFAIGPNGGGQ
ncbi:division/cell wall cluster transcriptional repressor MraZ [Parvibaculum sp.]|uniref:division/cell wall cluster transcriptional repressor MraZ n=1 Tax=Parvibaculum sp. TaxID=2024848 RepID=UPI0026D7C490|nr:division/cell wall cluster transcriptional repressor MraZ [Parvibaculum sp.]